MSMMKITRSGERGGSPTVKGGRPIKRRSVPGAVATGSKVQLRLQQETEAPKARNVISPGQSAQRDALGENIANYNLFAL